MRIMSHDVKLQAYSYQRTTEVEQTFREVIVSDKSSPTEDDQDILDVSHDNLNRGNRIEEDMVLKVELLKMSLVEIWIQALTGREFKFQRNESYIMSQRNGMINFRELRLRAATVYEYQEEERMSFESNGIIRTEGGETIEFSMNLHFSRAYYEKHVSVLEMAPANLKDPLVINLDGKGVGFSNQRLRIDLDMDGKIDEFNRLNAGNGFLALDRNGNGIIDDGSELFGPQTGQGFEELRQLDLDGNGWIDENDEVFDNLKVWQIDEEGEEHLIALKDADVGAIYLGSIGSQFNIKEGKELIARITDSSIYLKENGMAMAVQQVDLSVHELIASMNL